MNQLSQGGRGQAVPRRRPTSLALILQARAMRYRWFAATLAWLGAEFVARPITSSSACLIQILR